MADSAKDKKPSKPGMPAPESVISDVPFKSPSGKTYRILRTNETDSSDEPPLAEEPPSSSPD